MSGPISLHSGQAVKETVLFCNIEYSCWEVISKNKIMRDGVSNKLPVP